MDKESKKYFLKFAIALAFAHLGLMMAAVSFLIEWRISRMDRSHQMMLKTVGTMEQVHEHFKGFLKMENIKDSYRKQGIGAEFEEVTK